MNSRALVLFSGGQDSTTCMAWALERYSYVETIGFSYGQRHLVELECRANVIEQMRVLFPQWSAKLGSDHLLDLSLLGQVSDSGLTQERAIELQANGLPNTFVPGRNLLFFTFAATIPPVLYLCSDHCLSLRIDSAGGWDVRNRLLGLP